jgi:exopolysaccharide production protein ExoY
MTRALSRSFALIAIHPQIVTDPVTPAPPRRGFRFPEKLERAAGFALLVLSAPIIAVAALVVAALSRRPAFVAHLRVGQNDKPLWMMKLRTMWDANDGAAREPGWTEYIVAEPSSETKSPLDARVTSRFAAFCRRHSIDELPQLWHVFRGEMSLVGPRPLTRSELIRHYGGNAAELLSVKPGLTGAWQVNGRSRVKFPERAAMDLEMVRTLTPRRYVGLLLRTCSALVSGDGAW